MGGGYLIFIDADDWIEPKLFETFVEYMESHSEVDICMCNGFVNETSGQQRVMLPKSETEELLDSKAALQILFTPYRMEVYAKIYRQSILRNFKFDESLHMGEPQFWNWQLFKKARKVGIIPYKGYHYRMNPSGLSSKSYFECPYPYDLLKSAVQIYEDSGEDADIKTVATNHLLDMSISWLFRFLVNDKFEVKEKEIGVYLDILKKNKAEILKVIPSDSQRKILFEALAQNFDAAKADCLKIYNDFLSDLKNFCGNYENIFIYGNGYFGREIAETLNKIDCKNYSFVVSSLNGKSFEEIFIDGENQPRKIIDLNSLETNSDNTGIILAMNSKNKLQVIPALESKGYKNIFDGNKLGIHI